MIASLKSEFRKLATLRSTYIIVGIALLLIVLLAFYFEGYKGVTGSAASTLSPNALKELIGVSAGTAALLVSIICVLLMAHEYRYNTISYSLTVNASRTKFLISKSLAAVVFGIAFGSLAVLFALGCYYVGLHFRGATLPVQDINLFVMFGKVALYFAAYALIGVILASIIKNLVGTIAFLFLVPVTLEPLFNLVLKNNAAYLPFTMFDSIVGSGVIKSTLATTQIISFTILYLIVGWLIAWVLFLRRDAN